MADNYDDLLGGGADTNSASGTSVAQAAAQHGVEKASNPDDSTSDAELKLVSRRLKEYTAAREFDKEARKQYAKDRKYAAGKADPNWASDANLIGSFIDILVSFLYAQNPDIGCRPTRQVTEEPEDAPLAQPAPPTLPVPPIGGAPGLPPGAPALPSPLGPAPGAPPMGGPPPPGAPPADPLAGMAPADPLAGMAPAGLPAVAPPQQDKTREKLAETLELVVSQLWKDGNLKKGGKKMVRSGLSVGPGWIKATFLTQKIPAPQLEQELATQVDLLAAITAAKKDLAEGESDDPEADALEIQNKIKGLNARLAKKKRYGMMVDFVRAEDVQVSLDVSDLADYKEAGWLANDIYVKKDTLCTRFPRLSDDDVKSAAAYFQRNTPATAEAMDSIVGGDSAEVGQFSKSDSSSANTTSGKGVEFAKIIEIWDRNDQLVYTIVDGVKKWAVEPYPPPQATKRFYSLFYLAFYPVDGERHPQSLSWRLRKLQDEYSSARSNERTTRERSLPGIIFNRSRLDKDEADSLTKGEIGEFIGLKSVDDTPLQNLFISKPVSAFNEKLFNTEPILNDMERLSGVQEALSQAQSPDRETATAANIKQAGFQSRTSADRDVLEDVLDDLAEYTAECAIQECPLSWVQRVAGKNAFWLGPDDTSGQPGMDVEDLLTMVEVEIDAGTTGKPNANADKQAWAQLLPLLEKSLIQIRAMQTADPGLAAALIQVLRETLKRLDDRLDLDEFIPQGVPTPPPPPPAPPPQVKVNVNLAGTMPPGDTQALLSAESITLPHGPGGIPPGGAPVPPGIAATLPTHVAPGVPMPQLHVPPPKPSAGPPSHS